MAGIYLYTKTKSKNLQIWKIEVALLIPGKAAKNLKIFWIILWILSNQYRRNTSEQCWRYQTGRQICWTCKKKNFRQFALPYPYHKRQTTNVISAAGYKANTLMIRYYRSRPVLWYYNPSSVNYQRFHSIRKTGQPTAVYQS